ncbi:Serine palmitoyltransferase 1 [Lamellibrachia satsuma]|nr:Serine palmitoyltransferase 1 [Lamellibrachia satsuma]
MFGLAAEATLSSTASWDLYETIQALFQAPSYHLIFEAALILWIVGLLFTKSYSGKHDKLILSDKEKADLVEEWQPEPLVPNVPEDDPELLNIRRRIVDSKLGKYVTLSGQKCLNMATLNFLGMVGKQAIEEEAVKSLKMYGVGSCGPRGFYGTVDVHLQEEEKLAQFMGTEEAIVYSYGFATIASAIPAYSKRGDVIFCDEGVCFAIQKGIQASRSKVISFKHNDTADLERLLMDHAQEEKKNPKKAKVTRKFLIVEGLYINYGDICPLPQLMELKWKYKLRLFMDESISFGTLGKTGRGVTEHFSVPLKPHCPCSSPKLIPLTSKWATDNRAWHFEPVMSWHGSGDMPAFNPCSLHCFDFIYEVEGRRKESQVEDMDMESLVEEFDGTGGESQLEGMGRESLVEGTGGESQLEGMGRESLAESMGRESLVVGMGGESLVESMGGESLVESMGRESLVESMGRESLVEGTGGESQLEGMGRESLVESMGRESLVEGTGGESQLEGMGRESLAESMGRESLVVGMGGESLVESMGGESLVESMGRESLVESMGRESLVEGTGGESQLEGMGRESLAESMGRESLVEGMGGESLVERMGGESLVEGMGGESQLEGMGGESLVEGMGGESLVEGMGRESLVEGMGGESLVEGMGGESQLEGMSGELLVESMGGESLVEDMGGESLVEGMGEESLVEGMGEESLVEGMGRESLVEGMGRESLVEGGGGESLVEGMGGESLVEGMGGESLVEGTC